MTQESTDAIEGFKVETRSAGASNLLATLSCNHLGDMSGAFVICGEDGKELVRLDRKTGKLTVAEETNVGEAAKRFWKALEIIALQSPLIDHRPWQSKWEDAPRDGKCVAITPIYGPFIQTDFIYFDKTINEWRHCYGDHKFYNPEKAYRWKATGIESK